MHYENAYRLAYIRGPDGIIVELAEQLGRVARRSPQNLPSYARFPPACRTGTKLLFGPEAVNHPTARRRILHLYY
ncbi:hypothetical protein [Pseudomonas sp. W03]|uniref:hypothetical protein n=1 Tax=Pseudomonas sp. W03 TaxID=3090666 RepID=UPI003A4D410F